MINLSNYFDLIINVNYALTKVDVPYNPKNFPHEYAIGKDLDIFVSSDDYENIIHITTNYFNQYKQFKIKNIKNNNNFKLRLEQKKKLHYQIDITINDNLIKNKTNTENYFILSLENEKKVRLYELKKNPQKKHHKIWLDNLIT